MAKPPRSPLLGYNHNLTHLGRVFHIQTEDSGPLTPRLFTHLFHEGTILVSRKSEYDATLADEKVRALMQAQHKMVMKDLVRARLDAVIVPFFAARGEDLTGAQGAVPSADMSATRGPVVVLPEAADAAAEALGGVDGDEPAAGGSPAVLPGSPGLTPREGPADPPRTTPAAAGPRRTTRPLETFFQRGSTPPPVVVRGSDANRPALVPGGAAPPPTRTSSTDGVVVQRNVVVGGAAARTGAAGASAGAGASRSGRIRPPVPYVVTGAGQSQRPPRPVPNESPGVAPPSLASVAAPTRQAAVSSSPVPAPPEAPPRPVSGFGVDLSEDKSLDEVILEYLAEDGELG